jgi:hypothetical protein
MGVCFAAFGSMSVGSISSGIMVCRATISAVSICIGAVGISCAAISAMSIGSAAAGVGRAAIGTISIAGTRGYINSTRSRGYIDRSGWWRSRNYHHTLTKKPCAGRQ